MIESATQAARHLSVSTPLGKDQLLLRKIKGREEFSRLFEYQLDMLSHDDDLNAIDIVGQNVTFVVKRDGQPVRYWNGFVKEFAHTGRGKLGTSYRATVGPWLWFLTNTADCRIFQDMTTPEIIQQVFRELRFTQFDVSRLSGDYAKREYCVQYRETDFNFVSRLMEEEGIFYYFRHENAEHTLVLADKATGYFDLDNGRAKVVYPLNMGDPSEHITAWDHRCEFRPGRWAQTDYNFKTPNHDLMSDEKTVVNLAGGKNYEIFDYPGRFEDSQVGRALTRVRMEEYEAPHDTISGTATYRSFTPGGKFAVQSHRSQAEVGKSYVLTGVETDASVHGSYITGAEYDDEFTYVTRFEGIPDSVTFRPARTTPRPVVEGPQTAVVVGPKGEEIYTDEHARVKCQFHWDRRGRCDENSSCWMRVSQVHAGKGWGAVDLPRIGEEVIVDFLEGDPDRPLVTGRVYNAKNMPPFPMDGAKNAKNKTRRGNKTKTYKGSGYNEMSMDDTPGKEQIRMNAQHNMDSAVGNNQTLIVGVDRSAEIGNNDAIKIGNDAAENVGSNKKVTVGNNQNVDVGNKMVVNAGSSITLKCGASKIYMNSGGVITITGTIITTAAAANASVVAPLTQVIGGAMLTTIGGVNMLQGGVTHVAGAGLCSVAGGKTDVVGGTTSIKGAPIKLN